MLAQTSQQCVTVKSEPDHAKPHSTKNHIRNRNIKCGKDRVQSRRLIKHTSVVT